MPHDFKVGDIVECVDDGGGQYVQNGKRYQINTLIGAISVTLVSVFGAHYAARFKPIAVTAPGYVKEFTVTFAQTRRTPDIDIESRLMATWLAVPKGQCSKCGAPHSYSNPCAYHPNG